MKYFFLANLVSEKSVASICSVYRFYYFFKISYLIKLVKGLNSWFYYSLIDSE